MKKDQIPVDQNQQIYCHITDRHCMEPITGAMQCVNLSLYFEQKG